MSAMNAFTIALPEEQAHRLRELAREAGISPEQLLSAGVEEWLTRPGRDFAEAAAYVLQKNRELYRRLA
ncbi:MAG: ribbon-helix-helix protein, CopG family [Isosphaeraceae bacterium]